MNAELGRKVLNHVEEDREHFGMGTYATTKEECGTVACLAGHTMLLSGYTLRHDNFYRPDSSWVADESDEARGLLSLTPDEYYGRPGARTSLFGVQDEDDAIERFRLLVEAAEAAAAP